MIDFLQNLDAQILLFINGFHSEFFDRLMMILTGKFVWIPMYAALLVMIINKFKVRSVILIILSLTLAIALADNICAEVIRPVFGRMRPSNPENPLSAYIHVVNDYRGGRYGFPSCHGSNSFCLAVFMSLVMRKKKFTLLIMGWAVLHCYTRLYLGVHYPGDILVGGIIGSMCAFICYNLASYVAKRVASREEKKAAPVFRLPMSFARPFYGGATPYPVAGYIVPVAIFLLTLIISCVAAF